jgi:hypothetical protein
VSLAVTKKFTAGLFQFAEEGASFHTSSSTDSL